MSKNEIITKAVYYIIMTIIIKILLLFKWLSWLLTFTGPGRSILIEVDYTLRSSHYRCFPRNFVKFLRKPFYTEHLWTTASILFYWTDFTRSSRAEIYWKISHLIFRKVPRKTAFVTFTFNAESFMNITLSLRFFIENFLKSAITAFYWIIVNRCFCTTAIC